VRSGLLLIDKPTGMTSHDVVGSVRKISSQKQVGHAGTLDPLATGLMVVLMGEATKLSDYVLNGDKAYTVEIELGLKSDSGDRDGTILEKKDVTVTAEDLVKAADSLRGELQWAVPMFSAVKVDGQKLYDIARNNGPEAIMNFKPPIKTMIFKKVQVTRVELPIVEVRLECSKGSFVRTWVEKLGEKLGTGGIVSQLRRTVSIPYSLDKAITLDSYKQALETTDAGGHWVPLSESLPGWPAIKIDGLEEKLVKNGQIPHRLSRFLEIEYGQPTIPGVKIMSRRNGALISILTKDSRGFAIKRVFNS